MTDLQEAQLHTMLRALLARMTVTEGVSAQALDATKKEEVQIWDLFAQLVEHDHCELCGRAVWGDDHTC